MYQKFNVSKSQNIKISTVVVSNLDLKTVIFGLSHISKGSFFPQRNGPEWAKVQ